VVCGRGGVGLLGVGWLVGGDSGWIVGGSFEGTAEIEYSIDKKVYIPSKRKRGYLWGYLTNRLSPL